jgi:hypothetical protein
MTRTGLVASISLERNIADQHVEVRWLQKLYLWYAQAFSMINIKAVNRRKRYWGCPFI